MLIYKEIEIYVYDNDKVKPKESENEDPLDPKFLEFSLNSHHMTQKNGTDRDGSAFLGETKQEFIAYIIPIY